MKKKIIIACSIFAAVITVSLGVFIALFVNTSKKLNSLKNEYYVVVEDSLFDAYFNAQNERKQNGKLELVAVKASCFNEALNKYGNFPLCAATVYKNSAFTMEDLTQTPLTKRFLLETKPYFPSISADFTDKTLVNDPKLSVNITDLENLNEGTRALLVDHKYADDEAYGLTYKTYAECNILNAAFTDFITEWCQEVFTAREGNENELVFVASAGDIMVGRGVQEILLSDPEGLKKVFGSTLEVLQSNDITIGNLEGVLTENNKNAIKTYTFKFHKQVVPCLQRAGFNYFMQTNNHCYDYGETGFKDTLAALKEYNAATSGVGYNQEEAEKFYYKSVDGIEFAIISCGAYPVERSGFNGKKTATATDTRAGILWENEKLLEDIKAEKAKGKFVIVNVHGGEEYHFLPSKSQRELYQNFVDSGASVVFGSHPHVLQPIEWYNGSLIVYSLGNFVFNGMEGMKGGTDSEIVRLGIMNNKIVYAEVYEAKLDGCTVNLK